MNRFFAERFNVIRKSLRSSSHRMHVYHIRAESYNAAHTRGAEFQIFAESVFDLLFVVFNRVKLFRFFRGKRFVV